jgi:hypothetical protein
MLAHNGNPIEIVINALAFNGCKPTKTSNGYEAHCPAHHDEHKSLSISEGDDGKVLLKCHAGAGCSFEQIVAELGLDQRDLFAEARERARSGRGKITTTYDYTNKDGKLLYQVVRTDQKNFWQRRPDGNGGWINNLQGVEPVLYRLPQVMEAAITGQSVIIVEGEKDADRLAAAGWCATTNPQGAGKWARRYSKVLAGVNVAVIADNDGAGRAHAQQVAVMLHGTAKSVRVVELPGLPEHGDVSDWFANGGSVDDLKEVLNGTELWKPRDDLGLTPDEQSEFNALLDQVKDLDQEEMQSFWKELTKLVGKQNTATELVELVTEAGVELWHDPDMVGYATILVGDHQEHWPIRSRSFKIWLARRYYEKRNAAVSSQPMQDALGVLDGTALFASPEYTTHVRIAEAAGTIYIDLANPLWEYVEIDADGWRVVSSVPVRFRRRKGMEALPHPAKGGSLAELRPFVNVTDGDWALVVAWLVGAVHPHGPYAVLNITGEHGTAKSTIVRVLRSALDPNEAETPGPPTDSRDLAIAAENRWIVGYDNLSSLRPGLSDDFARLATGSGFGTRMLYENDEEFIFKACRPVVLDSIEDVVVRPDLLDRSLIVRPPVIPEDKRRPEKKFWPAFEEARPRIVGALFDAVSCALRRQDDIELEALPRMADFTYWVVAAEPALGIDEGSFLRAYRENRKQGHTLAMESDAAFSAILEFAKAKKIWTGPAAELARLLVERNFPEGKRPPRDWPTDGRKMAGCLQRAAAVLRAHGVTVTHNRDARPRTWTLTLDPGPTRTDSDEDDEDDEDDEGGSDQQERRDISGVISTPDDDEDDGEDDGPDTASDQHFDISDISVISVAPCSGGTDSEQLTIGGTGEAPSKAVHKATYSKQLLPHMHRLLAEWGLWVHDPFGGLGIELGRLCDQLGLPFTGTEIEEGWASRGDPRVRLGDATDPSTYPTGEFVVMTSPTYGNRCNDDFVWRPGNKHTYNTYRHWLSETVGHDQPLQKNNSGKYGIRRTSQSEADYWRINRAAVTLWPERVIVNAKDFEYDNGKVYPLVKEWTALLEKSGYTVRPPIEEYCPGNRYGENRDRRVDTEALLVCERPRDSAEMFTPTSDPKRFTQ